MKKVIIIIITLSIISFLLYFFWLNTNKEVNIQEKQYDLPVVEIPEDYENSPLYKDFDPTKTTVMFRIVEVLENNKIKVLPVFPETFNTNKLIETEISCEKEDIHIVNTFNKSKDVFDITYLNELISSSKESLMLEGLCSSLQCEKLVKNCSIYEYKE